MSSPLYWIAIGSAVVSAPVVLCSTYLGALAVLARPTRPGKDSELPPPLRFDVVIPAHNEEIGIARSVKSLLEVDYPSDRRHVIVVADNCTDATADRAREAGAEVLVRNDPSNRGKGFALARAFEHVHQRAWADVVVVVDADTSASSNLLWEFARVMSAGASAAQAHYGVRNPDASWRTRLMMIAFTLFHGVRSLARERLGLSAGLRGNGMAFSRDILLRIPNDAYSIVEDVEYGIKLGMAGVRVQYVGRACVLGDMVSGERQSRSQRQRWEAGRRALVREHAPKILARAFRTWNWMLFDLAADLLVPPLSTLVALCGVGTVAAVAAVYFGGPPIATLAPWVLSCLMLALYVFKGWMLSGAGVRGLLALLWAPPYMVWKILLALRGASRPEGEWVRTARGGEK